MNRRFRGGPLTADIADGRGSEFWLHPWFMAPTRVQSWGSISQEQTANPKSAIGSGPPNPVECVRDLANPQGATGSGAGRDPARGRLGSEILAWCPGSQPRRTVRAKPTLGMQPVHFDQVLDAVLAADSRYPREGYHFVREVLDHTQRRVHEVRNPDLATDNRHITGRQLLEGLREVALAQFGPMAFHVLSSWGIRRSEDVGEMVFNLVDHGQGMFNKTEQDSREAFRDAFDFEEVFRQPFLPVKPGQVRPPQMREA
jgi:uncharacterized repeat protein (TIGR04138 family)